MRIQVAIDRVTLEKAETLIKKIRPYADIVETGTSLIKDFGISGSVGLFRKKFPDVTLLADLKTCDEGAYEFREAYSKGADIATVMGFSSMSTIRACADTARSFDKEYMIDLLEVREEKLQLLTAEFGDAIFAIHLPSDEKGEGLRELISRKMEALKGAKKVAAAGGVRLSDLTMLKEAGIDLAIVGSAITKADNISDAARAFKEKAVEHD
jgi:3-hexulose-6-phosphate synthase